MQNLIQAFNEADCNVQLRHVPTETSWQDRTDHGYIAVYDVAGRQLARRNGFQHNCNLRSGGAWDASAVEAVVKEVKDALASGAKDGAKTMPAAKTSIPDNTAAEAAAA